MNKPIGYILSILGLATIGLSTKIQTLTNNNLKLSYIIVIGVALIAAGVVMLMDKKSLGKVKHAAEEVPIYEGEGKNKRIVGYKRAK